MKRECNDASVKPKIQLTRHGDLTIFQTPASNSTSLNDSRNYNLDPKTTSRMQSNEESRTSACAPRLHP